MQSGPTRVRRAVLLGPLVGIWGGLVGSTGGPSTIAGGGSTAPNHASPKTP